MNTRSIAIVTGLIGLLFATMLGYDHFTDLQESNKDPRRLSSYARSGSYEINPESILFELDNGTTHAFVPLPGEVEQGGDLLDGELSWTHADYLRVANAVSQLVWNEPLHGDNWTLYQVAFTKHCRSRGFDRAAYTLFRSLFPPGKVGRR
jgi:hypothetical protein